MVVALIALFVAMGGTGYAALNPKLFKNGSIPGKKLKRNSVTGRQVKESSLLTVPRARNAERFGGQLPGAYLQSGATAVNAQQLAGLGPTSFVRRECDQSTGQTKGIVSITASATFPATFTSVPGYNCSGQSIEARRLSMGRYEVRFNGSPSSQAVATPMVAGIEAYMTSITNSAPGLFIVYVLDPLQPPSGAFEDHSFTLVTY